MKEFNALIKKAEKLYPDNNVIEVYKKNHLLYDLKELKRNLKAAIIRATK